MITVTSILGTMTETALLRRCTISVILRELILKRWEVRDERRLRGDWVVLGRFLLDHFGETMLITEGAPADVYRFVGWNYEKAYGLLTQNEITWTHCSTPFGIPTEADRCPRCGQGWTISNAHDVYYHSVGIELLHKDCRRLHVVQRTYAQLSSILERAGIIGELRMIPSRYGLDDLYYGPRLVCETLRGKLVIGWRKRVINIDWSDTNIKVDAEEVTEDNTTKRDKYIHAWGEEKAVEYLNRIWNGT